MFMCKVPIKLKNEAPRHFETLETIFFVVGILEKPASINKYIELKNEVGSTLFPSAIYTFGAPLGVKSGDLSDSFCA